MPKFYKQNLLSSPLDTPELPKDDQQAEEWMHPGTEAPHHHYDSVHETVDPLQTFVSWEAPSRPYRKKDRSFYTTTAILAILVSLIALLAGQILVVGAVLALVFLVYVLNFIPPQDAHYKISNQGITIDDHFYHWQELDSFWFNKREGHTMLNILTHYRFPAVLLFVLPDQGEEAIKKIVAEYLPFHEIAPKSMMDKWSESLKNHFPLENPHKTTV